MMDEPKEGLPTELGAAGADDGYTPEVMPFPEEARPNIDHLVTEDGAPVDSRFVEKQQRLLVDSLYGYWTGPDIKGRFVAMANVGLFPGTEQTTLVPDILVSKDVTPPRDGLRKKE